MNVIGLLKRLGGFRKLYADDIDAALQPMRPDRAPAHGGSDTAEFTAASWPSGERKPPPAWHSDTRPARARQARRSFETSGT